jgi:hypothetical protein
LLLRRQGSVTTLPYVVEFKEFPLVLASMMAAARCGLVAVGASLLVASLYWRRIANLFRHPEAAPEATARLVSWSLFLITFFSYILIERLVFLDYPLTPDEFCYLFQAKLLARGQWTAPVHPMQPFFQSAFIAEHEGRLFSIMPIGWSFLLVPGILLGISWITSPLCTALAVVLTYHVARRMYGHRTGLLAAILMAPSPFVVFYAGTYMSHQASLLAFMAFLLVFVRLERGEQATHLYVLLGCVIGILPIIHHLEPAMLLPFLVLFSVRFIKGTVYPRQKLILSGVIAVVLCFSITGWHHDSLTGSPMMAPFQAYVDDGNYLSDVFGNQNPLGIYDLFTLKQRLIWTAKRLLSLNYCLFPLAPILMFLPVILQGRRKWDALLVGSVLCLMAGYMLYFAWGGIQFGPRYYFAAVGVAYILIAEAFLRLASRVKVSRRSAIALLVVLACVYQLGMSALLARFVPDLMRRMRILQNAGDHLAQQGIHNSVILLTPSESEPRVTEDSLYLRVRNGLDYEDDNLTAVDRGKENAKLMAYYPNRRFYLYRISNRDLVKGRPMYIQELNSSSSSSSKPGS